MSSATPGDGGDDIVADLMRDFPTPLNRLLVDLYEVNCEVWLSGPMANTTEAAYVRGTGLTPLQLDLAIGAAQQMDGDHRDLHKRSHSFPTRRSSDPNRTTDALTELLGV